jgi:hypothetical protein
MRQRDKFCRRVRTSGRRYMKMCKTYSQNSNLIAFPSPDPGAEAM